MIMMMMITVDEGFISHSHTHLVIYSLINCQTQQNRNKKPTSMKQGETVLPGIHPDFKLQMKIKNTFEGFSSASLYDQ